MKQPRISIVGAGQIGSRHLQALCLLEDPARIDLVDPSNEALQRAQKRFAEVSSPNKQSIELHCHNNLDKLPDVLDLVIVATNANIRMDVTLNIARKHSIKNFILEKALFQKKEQYFTVEQFLNERSIPTWVNCWMRTTDLFKQIKSALNLNDSIRMKIEGPRWGMGTNSIHFMDLFSYFTEKGDFEFTDVQLDGKIIESKRTGFKEFLGRMAGQNSRGDSLDLICRDEEEGPITLEIINGHETYTMVTDFLDHVDFKSSNGLANSIGKATFPRQSQLTHVWVKDILSQGSCDLPTYSASMPLHLELIRVLTDHFQQITGKNIDACPIT